MCSLIPCDIPGCDSFAVVEHVSGGYSDDEKFLVEAADGQRFMLRLSDAALYERRRGDFETLRCGARSGLPMPHPVRFGMCDGGARCFMLLTWVEGRDLGFVLAESTEDECYRLGLEAGRLLKRVQGISSKRPGRSWEDMFDRQLLRRRRQLAEAGIDLPGLESYLSFIEKHRSLLRDRPFAFAHGDYHVGNLLAAPNGTIAVIDFDRCRTADPWDDHKRVVWDVEASPAFACGRIDGYFDGTLPQEFWLLLGVYCASNAIGSIAWAVPFGQEEVASTLRQSEALLASYEGMTNPVPSWYATR